MQHQPATTFEEVIEANKDRIYRICRIYAVSPLAPEDLFQEVIYQIWKSYASFEGKSTISTWIYKIALNVGIRSRQRLHKKNEKTTRLEAIQFAVAEEPVAAKDDQKYEALRSCISQLKEVDRSIVILSLEDAPYKEIASITGLSENYVAVKMKRIRALLLDCITAKLNSYVG